MYNVIIADDERLIREGLAKFIPWNDLGLQVIGVAENGLVALELAKRHHCDILVTDIRMPGMDGFRLVEELLGSGMSLQVILISSYDDFAYAQRAVQLNVIRDYVLKPVDTDKFCEVLKRVCAEMDAAAADGDNTVTEEEYLLLLQALQTASYDRHKLGNMIGAGNEREALALWARMRQAIEAGDFAIHILRRFCSNLVISVTLSAGLPDQSTEETAKDPVKPVYLTQTKVQLLDYIDEFIAASCRQRQKQLAQTHSRLVDACLQEIEAGYISADMNLTTLAAKLNVSPSHLSVKFKAETGKGFMKYLIEKRMQRAKELLQDVRYKIYEISALVGFEDEKYFTRQFKNYEGLTPREYREKFLRKNSE